jgi:hypothetical protein
VGRELREGVEQHRAALVADEEERTQLIEKLAFDVAEVAVDLEVVVSIVYSMVLLIDCTWR